MWVRAPRALQGLGALVEVVVRAGREGRDPRSVERRRLLLAGGVAAFCLGTLVAGLAAGVALGIAGPWIVARGLRARREHYRHAVDAGAAEVALALADALGAGHSIRGALGEAARGVGGQAGVELGRAAAELASGAPTGTALEGLHARTGSPRMGIVVAACRVQGGAGGDLARLLRECAQTFGDQAQLEGEARTATAQARFTGLVVALLPLGGALLAELASPGFLAGLWRSWLTAWLVALALAMQAAAAVAIRRLARPRR
jgi:tight adherence protein B